MNWILLWCLLVVQSVSGDYNGVAEINGVHGKTGKAQVDKNAGDGLVKIRADGKAKSAFDGNQMNSFSTDPSHIIKPISSDPATFNDKLENQKINGLFDKQTKDQKFPKPNKSKYDKNGMQRSLDNLKKKSRDEKKHGRVLDESIVGRNSQNVPIQQTRERSGNKQQLSKEIDGKIKGYLTKEQEEKPSQKEPVTTLQGRDFDETENMIDDTEDNYDSEMKRLKKDLLFENMIPKSNKFLYNNKKYHDHLIAERDAVKHDKETKHDSTDIHHQKRNKRSVLSSIFVQMPHEDDESDSIDDDYRYASDNEESRDKKSKGSTTVCLEIKSDPTKPPSTICGPEIKPNAPLEPHMYDMASNQQYIPNSDYYTDKTIWSLNPLHDPNYYSSLSNYKYQSTNRQNHHQLNKHNNGNKELLDKNKLTSQVTTQDNGGYHTQNTISHDDTSPQQTLKTMPQASNSEDQDKNRGKTGLGQTPRNFLLENIQDNRNIGMPRNDNFKDLDLNLDGEMSTNTNSYANPSAFQENQFDPNFNAQQNGDTTGNGFMSEPDTFYPSTAYADSVGIWRGTEQPFQDDMQLAMSYDQLYGLDMNGETPQSFVEQSELRENSVHTDETNIPDESAPRSAYEYYPDRNYPYRPNTYPYVPSRPYPYRPRPYNYDRYDPDCRSGRCRSAEPFTQDLRNVEDMAENIVGSPLGMGARDALGFLSDLGQFRGDAYYSGRPYPYRPPYEYQGSYPYSSQSYHGASYPYSSQSYQGASYPYRPSYSGSTYPYDPNCRTADGRSCRESEEGKSANMDVNISPSVAEPNYALPSLPMSPHWAENNPRNKEPSFNDKLLGSPRLLPMTPSHVPVGLACNMIHAPVVPPHLISPVIPVGINPVIGTHGLGLGGLGHLHGGGLASGIGSHGITSGIGTHSVSFNTGITTSGLKGLSLKDSHQSFANVLSGVGSHGLGGSYGLVNHHLLGEKYQLAKETEDVGNEEASSKPYNNSLTLGKAAERTDTKTKPSVEELKSKIAEKLRAAEDKLKSSKSAILEKINKNIENEKKIEDNDDDNRNENEEKSTDAETKGTFFSPSVVPYPQGGGMTYNSEARNMGSGIIPLLTGSPNGSPLINLQTPLGGTITYDSPLFRNGILNRGFLGSPSPGFQNFQSGSSYQSVFPQCTCQPGTTQCVCPGTSRNAYNGNGNDYNAYIMNRNSQANLESSPIIYERTIVNPSAVFKSQYSSENGPILGLDMQEKSVYNSPASESQGTIESEQNIVKTPCMINKENQMRSSVNENIENVQLAQQPILQPIITPVFVPQSAPVLAAPTPMEVSFRAPSYEPFQYNMNRMTEGRAPSYEPFQYNMNGMTEGRAPSYEPFQYNMNGMTEGLRNQMYEYQPSPFVGFASLSEMKERNNQLKQNYLGYENYNPQIVEDHNVHNPNYNAYEDIYKESMMKQTPCNPSETSFKNSEESAVKTSNVKMTKKPALTELGKLPSKILTAKTFKLPAPILKLPKPNLRATQKEPCS